MNKIIHQIWIGPHKMPERELGFTNKMQEMHPDFTYHLWTNDNIPVLPPILKHLYDKHVSNIDYAFAADVLRLYVTQQFGGIYADVDEEPILGFSGLDITSFSGFFRRHDDRDLTIPNEFFGFSEHNTLIDYIINSITERTDWLGPSWFGAIVRKFFGLPDNASHELLQPHLANIGIFYMPSHQDHVKGSTDWWERHFMHRGLYSWAPEYKAKLKTGAI
jgi:hypothetical protein